MKKHNLNPDKILPIVFSAIASVFSLGTSFILAKVMGQYGYGILQYNLGLANILSALITFGITFYLTKEAQFSSDKNAFFSKYLILFDIIAVVAAPIVFLLFYFTLGRIEKNVLLIFTIYLAAFSLAVVSIVSSFLLGIRKASLSVLFGSLLPKIGILGFVLYFVIAKKVDMLSDYYLFILLGVNLLSSLPVLIKFFRFGKINFSKNESKTLFAFFLLIISNTLNAQMAKVMQGEYEKLSGAESFLGVLSLSLQIVSLTTIISQAITTIAQPIFSEHAKRNDSEGLLNAYKTVLRINSAICVPFNLAFICEADTILSLFGSSYVFYGSSLVFILISCAVFVSSVTGPSGTLLTFANHEKLQVVNGLVSTGVFVGVSLSLLYFTPFGIPIAYLTSEFIANAIKLIEMKKIYKRHPIDIKTLFYILIMMAISTAVFIPIGLFIKNIYLWGVLNVAVGSILILAFFFLSPFREDRYFFKKQTVAPKQQ